MAELLRLTHEQRVGAALLALYRAKAFHENDKRTGGIAARQYRRTGTVQPWVISVWETRINEYEKELKEITE